MQVVRVDMAESNPSFYKTLEPGARKEIAREIAEERKISITRACSLMEIHKSFFYYEPTKEDSEIEAAIRSKARFDSDGFWKIYHLLRNEGLGWNHKRVYRVYKGLKFNKRLFLRRRHPARVKNPLTIPEHESITWSVDFVTDVLQSNRKFRVLNVVDDSDRVAVAQKIAPSMPAERVVRLLEEII
ncbi:MAG: hypothetical protein M0P13_00360 [Fibrobacteraceae bacterium]|nr:hypothetical protein [Fibrobacteraceae bacterium]